MSKTSYRLVLHKAAIGEIKALPEKTRARVKRIIEALAEHPTPQAARRLRGRKNAFRIRVGDYRVLYEVHASEIVVYVVGVGHRRDVYRRLLKRR